MDSVIAVSPDIFLCQSPDDQAVAGKYVAALEAEGFKVAWEQTANPAQTPDKATEQQLRTAKAVVVLWSQAAVKSRRVRVEVALGERAGRLAPALIENCAIPEKFEEIHAVEMQGWAGDTNDPRWQYFLTNVKRIASGEQSSKRIVKSTEGRFGKLIVVVEVVVLVALFIGLWLMLRQNG